MGTPEGTGGRSSILPARALQHPETSASTMRPLPVTFSIAMMAVFSVLPVAAQPNGLPPGGPPPGAPHPRDPILLPETTKKISPNVHVIPDADTTPGVPNVGIVIG